MAKVRVYELAKELGVESKTVMAKLNELGEFVRSASSTVEPPVVRKLRDALPAAAPADTGEKAPAKKAAAKKPAAPAVDDGSRTPGAGGPRRPDWAALTGAGMPRPALRVTLGATAIRPARTRRGSRTSAASTEA